MGKRNTRKNKKKIVKYECNNISENRMIEIQAEAFYRALKRIENERLDNKEQVSEPVGEPKKDKWYDNTLFGLNIIFFPWIIHERFKINKRIYDSVLVFLVSGILQIIGTVMYFLFLGAIGFGIYKFINDGIISKLLVIVSIGIVLIGLGSLFVLAGSEFSKETDSNKIYAYSASVLAWVSCMISMISCVISMLTLLKS